MSMLMIVIYFKIVILYKQKFVNKNKYDFLNKEVKVLKVKIN